MLRSAFRWIGRARGRHGMLLLALTAVVGCGRSLARPNASPESAGPGAGRTAVTVGTPVRATLKRAIEQPGHIEAIEQTPLFAKLSAFVRKVYVDIGDVVAADQVLADLTAPELDAEFRQKQALVGQAGAEVKQATRAVAAATANEKSMAALVVETRAGLKKARAHADRWQAEYQRVEGLVARKVIDEQTLDETRSQSLSASAALDEANARVLTAQATLAESTARREKAQADEAVAAAKLTVARTEVQRLTELEAYLQIKAPYAGVVTQRNVHPGHLLHPSSGKDEPLFVVARLDPVRIFVDVPEEEAGFVQTGATATVRIQALKGQVRSGKVSRTAWALDARTRTLRTAIDLDNPSGQLRPGMYAYATLAIEQPAAWTLPAGAVFKQGEQSFCFRVADGVATRLPVQLGLNDGRRVEVFRKRAPGPDGEAGWADLTGTEQIVLGGAAGLAEGQPVTAGP